MQNTKSEEQSRQIQLELLGRVEETIDELNSFKKVGRNESCPCGSGKKFKKCCMRKKR